MSASDDAPSSRSSATFDALPTMSTTMPTKPASHTKSASHSESSDFPSGTPFDLDRDGTVAMLHSACDHLVRKMFDENRPPLLELEGGEAALTSALQTIRRPHLPREPSSLSAETLFEQMVEQITSTGRNPRHPGALCFMPTGGILQAMAPDIVARGLLLFSSYHACAPHLARMESDVILWMCEAVGFPRETSFGFVSTGGSQGNWAGLVCGREARIAADPSTDLRRCSVYASEEVHCSISKGMRLAGIPPANLRRIPVNARHAMCVDELRRAMEVDVADGFVPLAVVASAGCVVSGAIDDFKGIRAVADQFGCWVHVDGAYGGFFVLSKEGKELLEGIATADSVSLDAHKSLFLPPAVGLFLTRHVDIQRIAFGHERAAYLGPPAPFDFLSGSVDIAEISPEQTREPRGLRLWFPLVLFGADAFGSVLSEKLRLARYLASELRSFDMLEIVTEPYMSILTFKVVCHAGQPHARTLASTEKHAGAACSCATAESAESACRKNTTDLIAFVNAQKHVLLFPVTVSGVFAVRVCILSYATHKQSVDDLLADLRQGVKALGLTA